MGSSTAAAVTFSALAIVVFGADAGPVGNTNDRVTQEPTPVAAPAQLAAANAPAARPAGPVALPAGVALEKGLQVETILAARAVSAKFPEVLDIGGVRADSMKWHPNGLAIDVMVPHYATPEGKALGERIVAYALENAERFGVNHVIFRQEIYHRNGSKRWMSDRGSATANHYDHVHIATDGGGFPTGRETYLL